MAQTDPKPESSKEIGRFWRIVPLVLVLIAIAAVFATGIHRSLTLETFVRYQAWLQDLVAAHGPAMLGL